MMQPVVWLVGPAASPEDVAVLAAVGAVIGLATVVVRRVTKGSR